MYLDSATEKATQSSLDVQASFLDMSRSTAAGRILRSELELRSCWNHNFCLTDSSHDRSVSTNIMI